MIFFHLEANLRKIQDQFLLKNLFRVFKKIKISHHMIP